MRPLTDLVTRQCGLAVKWWSGVGGITIISIPAADSIQLRTVGHRPGRQTRPRGDGFTRQCGPAAKWSSGVELTPRQSTPAGGTADALHQLRRRRRGLGRHRGCVQLHCRGHKSGWIKATSLHAAKGLERRSLNRDTDKCDVASRTAWPMGC